MLTDSDFEGTKRISKIDFDALSDEEKKAYFIYWHEYWLLTFEHAREAFDLPYTYYLVPKEDKFIMVYMIDGERTHKGPKGEKAEEGKHVERNGLHSFRISVMVMEPIHQLSLISM